MNTQTLITATLNELPNGQANVDILRQELINAAITPDPSQVYQAGTALTVVWNDLLTAPEQAAAEAIIAAHQGAPFTAAIQQASANDDIWGQVPLETSSPNWVSILDHDTGYLSPGVYLAQWTAEMRCAPEAPGEDVELRAVLLDWQGVPEVELSISASDSDRWHDWTNGINLPVLAGERIHIRFEVRSVGGNSAASVRRMRLRIGRA